MSRKYCIAGVYMNRLRRRISIIIANTDTRLVIPCWKMDILLVVHIYRWKTCAITRVICHAAAACPRIST